MKKVLGFFLCSCIYLATTNFSKAQIICIFCYQQNDSISYNVTNLLQNGGFENHNCIPNNWYASSYCPNSSYYTCDIDNWTCTGGGTGTYADVFDNTIWQLVEGTMGVYFGSFYCNICSSNQSDTSCLSTSTDCSVTGVPAGYPTNDVIYGGSQGLSIEQTVNGLTIGGIYVLEFWTGGEPGFSEPGLFGVDIGFGYTYLRNEPTTLVGGIGTRFIIEFIATSNSHTIKFTNWGHVCSTCTELTLDDVRLYTLQELSSSVPPCAGATATAIFSAPNDICPGTCTNFTNLSIAATSFLWSFPGSLTPVSTDANPQNICYNNPGSYDVTLIASNANSSDTLTLANYITVYPSPPPQGISQSGDTLFANQGATTYQWYENGILIPGATNYFYVALESGNYNVVATDNNSCEVEAVIFDVIAAVTPLSYGEGSGVRLFPNPVTDKLEILDVDMNVITSAKIYNILGNALQVNDLMHASSGNRKNSILDVSGFSPGTYILEITTNEKTLRSSFIKK